MTQCVEIKVFGLSKTTSARRWRPEIMGGLSKESSHQALNDIRDSITELRYYREYFFRLN